MTVVTKNPPKNGVGRYSKEILVASSVGFAFASLGLHKSWIVHAVEILTSEDSPVHFEKSETALLTSLMQFGTIPASIFTFIVAQKWSQKYLLLLSSILFGSGFLIFAFVPTKLAYYVARFFYGWACGISFSVGPTYVSEMVSTGIRGQAGILVSLCTYLSGLIPLLTMGYAPFFWINLAFAIVPFLQFVVTLFALESPYLLMRKNNYDGAKEILKKLRKSDNVDEEFKGMQSYHESCVRISPRIFFEDPCLRKALLYSTITILAQQFTGLVPITSFSLNILEPSKDWINPTTTAVINSVCVCLSGLIGGSLVDKFGRKILFVVSGSFMTLMLCSLATYFYLDSIGFEDIGAISFVPALSLILLNVGSGIGLSSLPYPYMCELMPSNVRALGGCYLTLVGAAVGSFTNMTFLWMQDTIGSYSPFALYAVTLICLTLIIMIFLPETKGKTFAEIQNYLRNPKASQREQQNHDEL